MITKLASWQLLFSVYVCFWLRWGEEEHVKYISDLMLARPYKVVRSAPGLHVGMTSFLLSFCQNLADLISSPPFCRFAFQSSSWSFGQLAHHWLHMVRDISSAPRWCCILWLPSQYKPTPKFHWLTLVCRFAASCSLAIMDNLKSIPWIVQSSRCVGVR